MTVKLTHKRETPSLSLQQQGISLDNSDWMYYDRRTYFSIYKINKIIKC